MKWHILWIKGQKISSWLVRHMTEKRGMVFHWVIPGGETNTLAMVEARPEDLVGWLCEEPKTPPFPPGSLLYYREC